MRRRMSFIFEIILVLLLAACAPIQTATRAPDVTATQAAIAVQTVIAEPSRTATLPATQTPLPASPMAVATPTAQATSAPIPVTPLPGMQLYTFKDNLDYVLQIDPTYWRVDANSVYPTLIHQKVAGCSVFIEPGHGMASPIKQYWNDLGRFHWEILDYGKFAFARPVQGGGLNAEGGGSYLHLQGFNQTACSEEQFQLLKNLMTPLEAEGKLPYSVFASPTPRPPLEGFACPNTPPTRLRVGDRITVVTDAVFLRSSPKADATNQIGKYAQYPGVMIKVTDGPVCDKYVYWKVDVSTFGEGNQTISGWLAEGDLKEYYLEAVR